jgi:PPOX class probable F420-dependent enzyme
MTSESGDDQGAALARYRGVGVVATIRRDGGPHSVPVWYRFDGETINIWTVNNRTWVRNVARDPRVSFSIQENEVPFGAVLLQGHAELVDDSWPSFDSEVKAICSRYLPAGEVDSYVAQWPALKTIVRIRSISRRGWTRGY